MDDLCNQADRSNTFILGVLLNDLRVNGLLPEDIKYPYKSDSYFSITSVLLSLDKKSRYKGFSKHVSASETFTEFVERMRYTFKSECIGLELDDFRMSKEKRL
jgi:hypothetical protein